MARICSLTTRLRDHTFIASLSLQVSSEPHHRLLWHTGFYVHFRSLSRTNSKQSLKCDKYITAHKTTAFMAWWCSRCCAYSIAKDQARIFASTWTTCCMPEGSLEGRESQIFYSLVCTLWQECAALWKADG